MNTRRSFAGLIAVNIVMLALLAMVTWAPTSSADSNGSAPTGDYIMVGGRVTGLTSNGVYVLDQRSGFLIGFKFDLGSKKVKALSVRNVNQDAAEAGPGR